MVPTSQKPRSGADAPASLAVMETNAKAVSRFMQLFHAHHPKRQHFEVRDACLPVGFWKFLLSTMLAPYVANSMETLFICGIYWIEMALCGTINVELWIEMTSGTAWPTHFAFG